MSEFVLRSSLLFLRSFLSRQFPFLNGSALRAVGTSGVLFCNNTHDGDLRFLHHLFTISEEARRTTTMKMMMMGLRGLAASALLLSVTEGAYRNEIKVC